MTFRAVSKEATKLTVVFSKHPAPSVDVRFCTFLSRKGRSSTSRPVLASFLFSWLEQVWNIKGSSLRSKRSSAGNIFYVLNWPRKNGTRQKIGQNIKYLSYSPRKMLAMQAERGKLFPS